MSGWKRVWLQDDAEVRLAMRAICWVLCNGDEGTKEGEALFEWVTEKRQSQNTKDRARNPAILPYSCCGDLGSSGLVCVGSRDETLCNCNKDGGVHPWQTGQNVTFVVWGEHGLFKHYSAGMGMPLDGGDLLVLWKGVQNTEHVDVVDQIQLDGDCAPGEIRGWAWTFDFGQWNAQLGYHGIRKKQRLEMRDGKLWIGDKFVLGYLPITSVPRTQPALVPDVFRYGRDADPSECDALSAPEWGTT